MEDSKKTQDTWLPNRLISPICNNVLLLCFCVALFDLVQSIYFVVQATILLVSNANLYSVFALLGSIFWILIVLLLIVGLWKGRLRFVIGWLIFSMIGIVVDIFFFVWTIAISDFVQWNLIIQFTLLYLGIIAEWFCVYIVYTYCFKNDSFRQVDVPKESQVENGPSDLKSTDPPEEDKNDNSVPTKSRKTKADIKSKKGRRTVVDTRKTKFENPDRSNQQNQDVDSKAPNEIATDPPRDEEMPTKRDTIRRKR